MTALCQPKPLLPCLAQPCSGLGSLSALPSFPPLPLTEGAPHCTFQGLAIPGMFREDVRLQTTARYIIVVEKDSVFQRLSEGLGDGGG